MSMTKEVIRKFVEEDYKDFCIMVTCDNQHIFFHNAHGNPPIIWDWDNNVLICMDVTDELADQNKHPMQITMVALEEIQFLDAFVDKATALKFINEKITDEEQKAVSKAYVQKAAPGQMGPRTLKKYLNDPEYRG